MLVADTYLGHRDDPDVADRLTDADPLRVTLSDTDRRRSRVRTETVGGQDLGVVVARDLEDGDVIETADGTLVVVELAAVEALVLGFGDADVTATDALALGHALGNRHWDLAVRGTEALCPVPDSRERMEATVADLLPDGVCTRFERVPPTTFDDGGADHSHDGHGQARGHDEQTHAHGSDGHAHSHVRDHDHGGGPIESGGGRADDATEDEP
jgi:urease accessory protein